MITLQTTWRLEHLTGRSGEHFRIAQDFLCLGREPEVVKGIGVAI